MQRMGGSVGLLFIAVSCSDAAEPTADTLDSLVDGTAAVLAEDAAPSPTTSLAPGAAAASDAPAMSGVVSIQVRLATSGVDETLLLDRATVDPEELDPISLFASCAGLDGGDEFGVAVTDLRRLATGDELVAVRLAAADAVTGAGQHDATLDVADATQLSTTYTGTMELDADLRSGTFDVIDAEGNAATGSFQCAEDELPSTSVPPVTSPPSSGAPTSPPTSSPPTSVSASSTTPGSSPLTLPSGVTLPEAVTVPATPTAP